MVTTVEDTSSYRGQCSVDVSDASLPEEDEEDASSSRNVLRNTTMLTDVTRQRPEDNNTSSYRNQCSVTFGDASLPEEDEDVASSSRNVLRNTTMLTDVTRQRPDNNTSSYRNQCSVTFGEASVSEEDEEDEDDDDEDEEEIEDRESLQRKSLSIVTATMQNSTMPSSIFMENSNDVQIGPRLHYNAPVTINQYVNVSGSEVLSQEDLHQHAVQAPEVGFEPTGNGVNQAKMTLSSKSSNAVVSPYSQLESKPNLLRLRDRKCWLTLMLGAMAITTAALLIYYYTRGPSSAESITPPVLTDDPPNPNTTLPDGGRILSKSDWGGFPAKQRRELPHPTPFVVISHTAGASCFDTIMCSSIVRNIQDDHIGNLGMDDIGYNFLVSGDGNVFEGRGWDSTNFHPSFVKRCNIGVCFMGHFVHEEPTPKQVTSVLELLDLGVRLGKLEPDYKLVAHSQTAATLSPGNNILSIIQKWPHFWVPKYNDTS